MISIFTTGSKTAKVPTWKGFLGESEWKGVNDTNQRQMYRINQSRKKNKNSMKNSKNGRFFFFRRLLFYELMCSSMLILRGNHMEGSQILFNSDSNSRSPSVCSSSGTWQLSKFGHRDPSFPSWLSNKKRWWLFWCHLCSLHGLSISKATGWCAFRRLLSLRRRF